MGSMNIIEDIKIAEQRIANMEEVLGRGLLQPFNNTNSGSRKLMFGVHLDQKLPLMHPEIPLIQTGYEGVLGLESSSFQKSEENYTVISVIPKFSFNPDINYHLILENEEKHMIDCVQRVEYEHITESFGYLYDNKNLDNLYIGARIKKGDVIKKSTSFDDYNNRQDGVNLLTGYLSCEKTMEDSIIISETASKKLTAPLIKVVSIVINDNDIPLNLMGDSDNYKTFPDLGDECVDGILCALRRENKEEMLYTMSYERLKTILMSDDKFPLKGKVIDINVYSNNPDKVSTSIYYSQINKYYQEHIRFAKEVINVLTPYLENGYAMGYEMQKLYFISLSIIQGKQYIKDRPFSNMIVEITIMEEKAMSPADKLTDRYGGKGVVSIVLPDNLMPRLADGRPLECIYNSSTCVNRENAGQLFEVSLNHISRRIKEYIELKILTVGECYDLYMNYIELVSAEFAAGVREYTDNLSEDELIAFIGSLATDNGITLSIKPITESMDLDRLANIYNNFDWAVADRIEVPIKGSTGDVRFVKARRPIICGEKYIYRLKQYSEEKFSATSLSSTNIRNENTRNNSSKNYKALYPKTPIRFGHMESGDMSHMGMEHVIINLMLHSASPHGRRLAEELMTGDPFNVDIKLDMDAKNRNVEILNAYLKTMGLKLIFTKRKKQKNFAIKVKAIEFYDHRIERMPQPIFFLHPNEKSDDRAYTEYRLKNQEKIRPIIINPIEVFGEKRESNYAIKLKERQSENSSKGDS